MSADVGVCIFLNLLLLPFSSSLISSSFFFFYSFSPMIILSLLSLFSKMRWASQKGPFFSLDVIFFFVYIIYKTLGLWLYIHTEINRILHLHIHQEITHLHITTTSHTYKHTLSNPHPMLPRAQSSSRSGKTWICPS